MSQERRYEIQRDLRETLFGKIFLGVDNNDGSTIIIKQCRLWNVENRISISGYAVKENVFEEVRLHRYLCDHQDFSPHILKLLDVHQDDDNLYIILEFAEGGELFNHVQRRNELQQQTAQQKAAESDAKVEYDADPKLRKDPNEFQTRCHMIQIMQGVAYMHRKFVCHRDLSLENVLLDAHGNVKLIDFGVALGGADTPFAKGNWETSAGAVGKNGYMAPEVWGNDDYDSRAADIWSCGVIFFILLVGYPPYQLPHVSDPRFKLIISGNLKGLLKYWGFLQKFSDECIDLLQCMLLPPDDRIAMDDILKHPFLNPPNDLEPDSKG